MDLILYNQMCYVDLTHYGFKYCVIKIVDLTHYYVNAFSKKRKMLTVLVLYNITHFEDFSPFGIIGSNTAHGILVRLPN